MPPKPDDDEEDAPNDTVAAGRLTVGGPLEPLSRKGIAGITSFSDSYQVRFSGRPSPRTSRNTNGMPTLPGVGGGGRHHPAARVHHHVDVQMAVEARARVVGLHDHVALVHPVPPRDDSASAAAPRVANALVTPFERPVEVSRIRGDGAGAERIVMLGIDVGVVHDDDAC